MGRLVLPLGRSRRLTITVLAAAVYLLAAELGLRLAFIYPSVMAVWAPGGIALAVFLLAGYYVWPGIFVAAFLANLTTIGSVWTSLGIATGNTLEGLIGAYLVRRFANGTAAPDRPADRLELAFRSEPRNVRLAREALGQFTALLGLTDGQGRRAGVALSEAVNNVVEHAYGASVGTVRVRARREGTWLRVEVEDEGRWRAPRPDERRGRGIPTMRAMVDTVDVDPSPSGTLVRFGMSLAERRGEAATPTEEPALDGVLGAALTGTVTNGAGQAAEAPEAAVAPADVPVAQTGPFEVGRVNGIPVVEVAGDVDLSNAYMLQTALEQAARTEQRTVVVSLGGTAYFDSQGMHMLLRFNRRLEISRRRLVVVVPWHHPLKAVLDALGSAVNVTVVQTLAQALDEAQSGR